jgi:threonylcarbamoyladenosine tRNA methylthiotransferase MtaB
MDLSLKTAAYYTLGCKLNFSETSAVGRLLEAEGVSKVDFKDGADIYIINTCSVTDNADKKCRKLVRDVKKIAPHAFICIMGCYAQLKPREIAAIPGVNAVLGANEKFKVVDILRSLEEKGNPHVAVAPIKEAVNYHAAYSFGDRTRTFLKVQDGCNYHCSFCTIPLARGRSRSATIEEVVNKAASIARTEVQEIVLTGVNIGDFGIVEGKRKERFTDLVQALDRVEGIARMRISSIEPNLLSNEIIEYVSRSQRFVPHFHIPLQSGSNTLLRKMRRRYLRELYTDRVQKIKQLMPDAGIGVDVIVGFPGETDEEFMVTYRYLNELPVSYLHVFTYSERSNTPAPEMDGTVPVQVRRERSEQLRTLSLKKKRAFYESQLGNTLPVLFEEKTEDGFILGYTNNYVRVGVPYEEGLSNTIQLVHLQELTTAGWVEGTMAEETVTV